MREGRIRTCMKKHHSNIYARLPLLVPALFSALLCFVMIYICFYRLSLEGVPAPIQKLCILLMAGFLGWLAFTLVAIAFRDYYKEIRVKEDSLEFLLKSGSIQIKWEQIKHVSETSSTLLITTIDGKQIGIGADVTHFEELKEHVKWVVNEIKRKQIR